MALKDTQQTALDNLAALLTEATTGLRKVHTDPPGGIGALPCLVILDEGLTENRHGQWRELLWDLRLQVYVQVGKLEQAVKKTRDIRADLIDRLGTDITLGGVVRNTLWIEEPKLLGLAWGEIEYAGVDGVYRLVLREDRSFA